MTNEQFLEKIKSERNLQGAINNLATLAARVFELEKKLAGVNDAEEDKKES